MTTDIDKRIDSWKEQLLDLTRRNNMVDFSATKTKSLPTKHTEWRIVADELAEENELYVWRPDESEFEDSNENDGSQETTSSSRGDSKVSSLQNIAKEIENNRDSRDSQHDSSVETGDDSGTDDANNTKPPGADRPDNELISIRDPEDTENSLYNISLNQRKYIQEKGVDPLYITLGILEWYSVDYSDTKLRSPLFLASVSLDRETVSSADRHDYIINPTDTVIINPALRKKLKSEFDIQLPADEDIDITTLEEAIEDIKKSIEGRGDWTISNEVILGIFDFAKLSLYNDLEEQREAIKANPIVRALNGDPSDLNTDTSSVPTADELDDTVEPTEMFQVLEADSSQQEAIEAAKAGVSFVLQGPPGTGKSQTIANIIAEKLASGDRILFVSEKQAALDVVRNRLDDVGLGRFCLPAHGKKADKDEVLSSLERELNAPLIEEANQRPQRLGKLKKRRQQLNDYGELLLEEYGEISTSAYEAHGIVSKLDDVPSVSWNLTDPLAVTAEDFERALDLLESLSSYEDQIEQFDSHPWSYTTLRQWRIDTADNMRETISAQQYVIDDLITFSERLVDEAGVELETIAEIDDTVEALELLQNRPDIDWTDALLDPGFYLQEEKLQYLAKRSRELADLRQEIDANYDQSIYSEDPQELYGELSGYGFLRYVSLSYRRLKNRILDHAVDSYDATIDDLKEDMQTLMEIQSLEDDLDTYSDLIQQLGHLYHGTDTDWEQVMTVRDWVEAIDEHPLISFDGVASALTEGNLTIEPLLDRARTLQKEWRDASEFFRSEMNTEEMTTKHGEPLYQAKLETTQKELASLGTEVPELQDWVQFMQILDEARDTVCGGYIDVFLTTGRNPNYLVEGFRKEFYTQFLNTIYDTTPLGQFNPAQYEQAVQEFRKLDKKQQELAKVEIQHRVTSRRPQIDLEHASSSQQVTLRREIEKQRRRKPLRELFDEAGEMITRLKPCFMMSPLSVAQHLKTDSIDFDCVIFDEASQIMPQDAISSIIRAEQAIIAGDTKQLPPTSFFSGNVEADEDVRQDLESILDEAAAVLPEKHLRWHYRSRTDELIAFSNQKYYAGRLNTFPENNPDVRTGVDFEYVEDGIYDRGASRQNIPEAERVVDKVQRIAENHPEKSVGVVAFSEAQERAIRDIIEERRQDDFELDQFVDEEDALEGFFVKNLESVQGDERDVMIFSVGYGPDQAGKITMNFGPLNNDGGERRLNVAVTRARERVLVISSLQPGDIDLSRTSARGVQDFKTYLEYAKKGDRALVRDDQPTESLDFDSTFEEAVYTALEEEGYDVETQIQSSGYSIDLAIKHPEKPGKYILGIECDGAAYHSSKTARDRDRTRQMILEDLGWTIHRIWSPDWASNQKQEIKEINERVDDLIEESGTDQEMVANVTVEEETPEPADPVEIDGGAVLFEQYVEPEIPTKRDRDFDDISNRTLRNELIDLVNEYGPIEKDEALTNLVQQWQFSRVGKRMRRSLNGIVGHISGSHVVQSREFLWPQGLEEVPVRLPTEADSRSVDQVPIEELAKAAYIILENGLAMSREDLILETARHYGWERLGKNIRQRLNTTVDYLVEIDAVEEGEQITPNDVDIDEIILDDIYK